MTYNRPNTYRWRESLVALLAWLCLMLLPAPGEAGIDIAVYGELPLTQDLLIPLDQGRGPGHGIVFFQYTDQTHFGEGNQLRVGLNTETIWLAWDLGATSGRGTVLSLFAKGQFGFAEMLPDYIAAGRFIEELSFFGLYAEAGAELRHTLFRSLSVGGALQLRYWWFAHRGISEESGLILPANGPGLLSHVFVEWDDRNTNILGGRLSEGVRVRLEGRLRRRFVNHPWGGFATSFNDQRNRSQDNLPSLQTILTMEGTVRLHHRLTLSLDASAAFGWFADDIQRFKVGGDNDYIPMLSGTYFAEFVVDAYVLTHLRLQWLPIQWLRITPQLDLAWLPDGLRRGRPEDLLLIVGLGLGLDFFIRDYMRIHIKFGYSPNAPRPGRDGGFKAFFGYVWSWW